MSRYISPEISNVTIDDPLVKEGGQDKIPTTDLSVKDILEQMLISLKKIEFHLSVASDTEINDQDIGG